MAAASGGTSAMLPAERRRASFNSEELMSIIQKDKPAQVAKFAPLFADSVFDGSRDAFRSYAELFDIKQRRQAAAFDIVRNNNDFLFAHMKQKVKMEDYFEHHGIFIHFSMLLNYLKAQGTPKQQAFWSARARDGDFLGAYAQTELGHGSNVRGLETTASYHPDTQEFEIHSPTLTSLKFWPTGMYSSTHAVVFAQLTTPDGTRAGVHGFMVQLRDSQGALMPGVEVGEIGPKLNTGSANIGYARFTHVRVPLDHFFSKNSRVTAEGRYEAAPKTLSKFGYIAMMKARVHIVGVAFEMLAKAVTIAVRYSAVRVQGFKDGSSGDDAGTEEHTILDYTMQQSRLFRALSLAYTLCWNRRYLIDYIKRVEAGMKEGDAAMIAEYPVLHATLSGLKATATVLAHECIEDCRKCCGGQGFLLSSGVAKLSPDFAEWVTVEGEQVILSMQTARFLLKATSDVRKSGPEAVPESVRYLAAVPLSPEDVQVGSPAGVVALLRDRARRVVSKLAAKFEVATAQGLAFDAALNSVARAAYAAAEAHVSYVMVLNNQVAIPAFFGDKPALAAVMIRLMELQGLQMVQAKAGDWLSVLTEELADALDDRVSELLLAIRPDAVALVDGFGFLDKQLNSTLGRYDGNCYEAIYDQARSNPLNLDRVMSGWDVIAPTLDLNFLDETAKLQRVVPPHSGRGSAAKL